MLAIKLKDQNNVITTAMSDVYLLMRILENYLAVRFLEYKFHIEMSTPYRLSKLQYDCETDGN